MKVVLVDDQPDILQALCSNVKSFFSRRQIEAEIDSFSCLAELGDLGIYDIALLDIELPDGTGLQVAKLLQAKNKNIIILFVTSYQHYLDDAMDLNVFRYITKPVDQERLTRNLVAAWKRYCSQTQMICIGYHGDTVRICTSDIYYISIKNRGTELVTEQGTYESTHSLKHWVAKLGDDQFAQPHYSYLVNLRHVIDLKKSELTLLKEDGQTISIPVSQRQYPAFKQSFFAMIGGAA